MFSFDRPFIHYDLAFLRIETIEGKNIGGGLYTGEGTESWFYHIELPCEDNNFTHCIGLDYILVDRRGFMDVETYY
jgi:hypothetical protein